MNGTKRGEPFVWTAAQTSLNGRTIECDWCGSMTDWLGSQMGATDVLGWACRDCMKYGLPDAKERA